MYWHHLLAGKKEEKSTPCHLRDWHTHKEAPSHESTKHLSATNMKFLVILSSKFVCQTRHTVTLIDTYRTHLFNEDIDKQIKLETFKLTLTPLICQLLFLFLKVSTWPLKRALPCIIREIKKIHMIKQDFSSSQKCNFYEIQQTKRKIHKTPRWRN